MLRTAEALCRAGLDHDALTDEWIRANLEFAFTWDYGRPRESYHCACGSTVSVRGCGPSSDAEDYLDE